MVKRLLRLFTLKANERWIVSAQDPTQPSYVLKPLPPSVKIRAAARDYYGRLLRRQPKALTPAETRQFWEEDLR